MKTKNLRVIQLLLGHEKLERTVQFLGIEVDDVLEIIELIEVSAYPGCYSSSDKLTSRMLGRITKSL